MKYKKDKWQYIIRLEKGERIVEKLLEFCQKEELSSGFLSAIGAVMSAEIGFYDLERKEYEFRKVEKAHEIVSLTGNIALVDKKPFLHIHCVLSDKDFNCVGGHLKEGVVGATCEVYLEKLDAELKRAQDDEIGLKLLDIDSF